MDADPYESIFASFPYGICVVDHEGKIIGTNPALERLLGWHSEECHGQPLALYLEQALCDYTQELSWTIALSQALSQDQTTYLNLATDFRTGSDDAPPISLKGIAAPWRDSRTEQSGAIMLFSESSSEQDREGARSRFLGVLAHELGMPVTNLTFAAEQLTRHIDEGDEEPWRLAQVILTETRLLRRLLAQFPSLMPGGKERPRLRHHLVTLRPCLRRVAQAFQLRDLDCEIVVQVPPDLPFVWSEEEQIQQILSKLLDNAIRYAPPASQIILSAEVRGEEIVVSVQDRGPGVSAADAKTIFEPWRRGSEEEPDPEHQGLGLAVAESLVRAIGGKLWHERPPEGGARFCFTLPRAETVLDE